MKDLKENIQKNNMKKLVLSAALGMFCYCTNNAMDPNVEEVPKPTIEININDVLMAMLEGQINIFNAKNEIGKHKKKIYSTIKDEDGKVKKGKLLEFIKNQFTEEEQKEAKFENKIRRIEQYFHLEEKGKEAECTKDNLTERFWVVPKTEEEIQGTITEEEKEPIKQYFNTIIKAENNISKAFKRYYEIKKEENPEAQDEDILKEIMEDCCGNEKQSDIITRVIENLKNYWNEKNKEEGKLKNIILTTIRSRIYLGTETPEKEFIYFLKQKIGIEEKKEEEKKEEEKKEEEKKNEEQKNEPKKEKEGCPCCNC